MQLISFIRKLRGVDARQCNKRREVYPVQDEREPRNDVSGSLTTDANHDVIIEYSRADQAKIGQMLRERYDELAQEELPRDLLEALYDLDQRLQRRGGE